MGTTVSKVIFRDGAAVGEVVHVFLAASLQAGDYNLTRLFFYKFDGQWSHKDVETIAISVCVIHKPKRIYFALGRDGRIFGVVSGGNWFEETISDAGTGKKKFGYLTQMRNINDELYACGHRGQVYRRTSGGWVHMDNGIIERETKDTAISHNAIDGTGPNDIYVVGDGGKIFHYDGRLWDDVSPATNLNLINIRCVSNDEVYVCGKKGLLLRGNYSGWRILCDAEMEADAWDLEFYKSKLYLVLGEKLMVHDGNHLSQVDTKLSPPIDAYHLDSRNGILWSFGEEDLAFFDGNSWTRVIHPDNI
jgi:hypothetical protein